MNDFGKKMISFALVAVVSSAVSVATYTLIKERGGVFKGTDISIDNKYALPTGYMSTGVAQAIETDFTKAAEITVNAVVHIASTEKTVDRQNMTGDPFFDLFFGNKGGNTQSKPRVGFGSGVIISSDGYIVTNNHVIDNSQEVKVTLNDNRSFNAKVIGTDPSTDLALLKIEQNDLPVVVFGNSDNLKVGEWVLAVGNPFQLNSTVTAGIVSAKARSIGILSNTKTMGIESFIQTDAAVNPGNSGGALVNTRGELVGINTAIFSQTGNFAGYAFAVPSSIVTKVVTDLKQYGAVQRAVLGVSIQDITDELAKQHKIDIQDGVYVADVVERSAAMDAGIEKGDVITSVNGVAVKRGSELQEQVNRYRPGNKIKIAILRGKQNKTFDVTLKNYQGNTDITKPDSIGSLGVTFESVSRDLQQQLGIRSGVQIINVSKGRFEAAGIRKGFIIMRINDRVVSSAEDIESLYMSITKGSEREKVMFIAGVYPNGKTAYYAVDLAN